MFTVVYTFSTFRIELGRKNQPPLLHGTNAHKYYKYNLGLNLIQSEMLYIHVFELGRTRKVVKTQYN